MCRENKKGIPFFRYAFSLTREGEGLARALGEEHHADGLEDDPDVQQDGHVFGVVQVILQLAAGILDGGAVRVTHLSPAGDAGLDRVAQAVEGDFLQNFI